ncbi:RsmB/NOP family class I SAM-dependent RNA methyltransferase [Curtanaerobium respiraculi]|uniref:RsmB/NOP family class I SAM-dependent RNA methyltransferase n=1 Tax=Curtanaerobium respiraculi TaxID=2949669 RepID=UPI0024B32790|nr:transcription antitermination factor NusB [Curtanaerobium respiraculi]
MSRTTNARRLACEVGAACRERSAFAGDVLDAKLEEISISPQDAAFARVLSLGVAATRGTLDEVLNRCMNSPSDVRAYVRDALRVSAYEIIFLGKDAYVAVDQGVGLVRSVEPRASRLANAVLRKVARAAESFPFGDPTVDDAALARLHGFPRWLAQVLIVQMGRAEAARFMAACNHPPAIFVGVNAIRSDERRVQELFLRDRLIAGEVPIADLGAPGSPEGPIPGCLKVADAHTVATGTARRLFREGAVLISDAAAQYIADLALPEQRPRDFLEIGSGRGTKSVLLQSCTFRRWGAQLDFVPVDSHPYKIELLRKRMSAYGCLTERAIAADARDLSAALGQRTFDAAFVDAPCSGVGTLRRHPEIRWRLRAEEVNDLAKLQLAMVTEASRHVRVGGQLTYSTCSPLATENEFTVKRFLDAKVGAGYRILPYGKTPEGKPVLFFKSSLQPDGCDAHFAARLLRVE